MILLWQIVHVMSVLNTWRKKNEMPPLWLRLLWVLAMSHHRKLTIDGIDVGHVRITNTGTILSVWIKTDTQQMLFLPEHPILLGEEE